MEVKQTAGSRGIVTVTVRDVAPELPAQAADQARKARRARNVHGRRLGPVTRRFSTENVVVKPVHELIVDTLNPNEDDDVRETISHLALGEGTAAEGYTDTALGNEVARVPISEYDAQDNDTFTTTFLAGNELVGEDISEVGLATGDVGSGRLVNHAIFDPADRITSKSSAETITIDIRLQWRSVT